MQIKVLNGKIREQTEYIRRLKDSLSIAGIRYDKDRVQSSPDSDKFAYVFSQIDEEEKVIEQMKTELVKVRIEIINRIHELDDHNKRELLMYVYVDCKNLKKAAPTMNFSYAYIKELHAEALQEFEEKFLPEPT
jgi:DNA-directed RNA polymerase specialized sigma subunit